MYKSDVKMTVFITKYESNIQTLCSKYRCDGNHAFLKSYHKCRYVILSKDDAYV